MRVKDTMGSEAVRFKYGPVLWEKNDPKDWLKFSNWPVLFSIVFIHYNEIHSWSERTTLHSGTFLNVQFVSSVASVSYHE